MILRRSILCVGLAFQRMLSIISSVVRSVFSSIYSYLKPYVRVLIVLTKPSSQEYKRTLKVTGFGIILIGLVGFLIFLIAEGIKRFATR